MNIFNKPITVFGKGATAAAVGVEDPDVVSKAVGICMWRRELNANCELVSHVGNANDALDTCGHSHKHSQSIWICDHTHWHSHQGYIWPHPLV